MTFFKNDSSSDHNSKFETLYTQYRQVMYYTAYNVLLDAHAAEDVVHQAFIRVIKNLDKINLSECHKTKAYLVIITEHIAIDLHRKRLRENHVSYEASQFLFADEPSVISGFSGELNTAFHKMQIEYASVLILKYHYGYSIKEIAKMLNLTEANTRQRLSRAKKQLAKILKAENERSVPK